MNLLEKIFNEKKTENGDVAYKTTGDNLTDLMFMTSYFEKNLDQVRIGTTEKEKLFSMFVRDPRFGLGKRDLGRKLMKLSNVSSEDIVLAGRYDDLFHIARNDCIDKLHNELINGNELTKKWMPRLTGKYKKIAKIFCKIWGISEKDYRRLIKSDKTVEYKLSYAELDEVKEVTKLGAIFNEKPIKIYKHPLVCEIDFEQVPSLAMHKYLNTFSTRDDLKERFKEYINKVKENKAKVNTSTSNVVDAYKTARKSISEVEENADVIAKKTLEDATLGVKLNCIPILDTSGSMYWNNGSINIGEKATAVAHALSVNSTYCPNQVISFSSKPRLMTIKGTTLKEQYKSLYTGDCSNTDFKKVMEILRKLESYPEYLVVLSDMEFDCGSNQSKKETMKIFKEHGANTKIIWWNFNDRNKTAPEFDEYGNIYLSGYNLQILKLLENNFDMSTYIEKILVDYKKKIGK